MTLKMTREEFKKKYNGIHPLDLDINCIIDEIFYDVESRTCENCKHLKMSESGYNCFLPYHLVYVELDFGCNKWEPKQ